MQFSRRTLMTGLATTACVALPFEGWLPQARAETPHGRRTKNPITFISSDGYLDASAVDTVLMPSSSDVAVDISGTALGGQYAISSRGIHSITLDAGVLGRWGNVAGRPQAIRLQNGEAVRFLRVSPKEFSVVSFYQGESNREQPATAESRSRPLTIFAAGQSYAQSMLWSVAHFSTLSTLKTRTGLWAEMLGYAVGGSSALKRFSRGDKVFWWNEDTWSEGPLLIEALAQMAALPRKPSVILWMQSQQDTAYCKTVPDADLWMRATAEICKRLGEAGDANGAKLLVEPTGRRPGFWTNPDGIDLLRDRQVQLINAPNGIDFMAECYDVELLGDFDGSGDSHWHDAGALRFGKRVGERIAGSSIKSRRSWDRV